VAALRALFEEPASAGLMDQPRKHSGARGFFNLQALARTLIEGEMTKQKLQPKPRHVPERTCVACRTQRPKRALIRVVHTLEGAVVVDETGKQKGRGAYLCRQQSCWDKALKQGSLDRALRIPLTPEMMAELRAFAATLPAVLPENEASAA